MNIEKIKVNTSRLQNDERKINESLQAVKNEIKDIYEDVAELDNMWEGSANEAFKRQFRKDYETIKEVLNELTHFTEKMRFADKKYNECEKNIGDIISRIKV